MAGSKNTKPSENPPPTELMRSDGVNATSSENTSTLSETAQNFQDFLKNHAQFDAVLASLREAQPGTPEFAQAAQMARDLMENNARAAEQILQNIKTKTDNLGAEHGKMVETVLPQTQVG